MSDNKIFNVNGQTDYKYAVTSAAGDTSVTGLTLSDVTCTSATYTLASGTDNLFCGAKVTATKDASTANYALASAVTVTYD